MRVRPGIARLFAFGLLVGIGFSAPKPVAAEVNQFTAAPVLPADNAAGSGYFDLHLKQGQSRTLRLRLTNQATKAQTLVVTPTNAVTSTAGTVVYNQGETKTKPIHIGFGDLLTQKQPRRIRVGAGSSIAVSYRLKALPKQADGLILGAFAVTSATAKSGQHRGLVNLAQYLIGVSLHTGTNTIHPQLKLPTIDYSDHANQPLLALRLQNDAPAIIGKIRLTATLYRGSHRLQTMTRTGLNFAPSNRFWLRLPLAKTTPLLAGQYRLRVTVAGDNGHWLLSRSFTVSGAAGRRALVKRLELNWRKYLAWMIEALAGLIVLGYLIGRIRKARVHNS